jgi:hypothetical protein
MNNNYKVAFAYANLFLASYCTLKISDFVSSYKHYNQEQIDLARVRECNLLKQATLLQEQNAHLSKIVTSLK